MAVQTRACCSADKSAHGRPEIMTSALSAQKFCKIASRFVTRRAGKVFNNLGRYGASTGSKFDERFDRFEINRRDHRFGKFARTRQNRTDGLGKFLKLLQKFKRAVRHTLGLPVRLLQRRAIATFPALKLGDRIRHMFGGKIRP